jgi:spoIIIJ-associated protein
MEWVEVTARSIEAAKDKALDYLGVDESQAEFEILEEPRSGFLGFRRSEARLRARVKPAAPRAKVERRDRRQRRNRAERSGSGRASSSGRGRRTARRSERSGAEPARSAGTSGGGDRGRTEDEAALISAGAGGASAAAADGADSAPKKRSRRRGRAGVAGRGGRDGASTDLYDDDDLAPREVPVDPELVTAQSQNALAFLEGLVDAFDLDADVSTDDLGEGIVELKVVGDDLGLLVGPRGATLDAVQELTRLAARRQTTGEGGARLRVDIAGYRERRRQALARFAQDQAEQVRDSGVAKALEPMSPPDRKVVHDAVTDIAGVSTLSEGEEPYRRVVIVPS